MKKLIMMAVIVSGTWGLKALAHEGHDHDAPITLKAPQGGMIKALKESRVEVVVRGKDLKIYIYDKEMKPAQTLGYKVVAKVELPRTKKEEALALTSQDTFFSGNYDAKGVHRYTLKLAVTDLKVNRTDHLAFTIEPRK